MEHLIGFLNEKGREAGLSFTPDEAALFDRYADFLVEYNEKVNLTAITDPEGIAVRHFIDSVLPFLHQQGFALPEGARVIDIGSGAGFPSVPLKIMRPDIELTQLDSLNKRIVFLNQLSELLGFSITSLHGRAEEFGRKPEYREQFDAAAARAVANLRDLTEYCLPFVRVGGVFLAMKGPSASEEAAEAAKAIRILGGKIEKTFSYQLPDGSERNLVIIRKISQTPTKYPRNAGKMTKSPL